MLLPPSPLLLVWLLRTLTHRFVGLPCRECTISPCGRQALPLPSPSPGTALHPRHESRGLSRSDFCNNNVPKHFIVSHEVLGYMSNSSMAYLSLKCFACAPGFFSCHTG